MGPLSVFDFCLRSTPHLRACSQASCVQNVVFDVFVSERCFSVPVKSIMGRG